MQAQAIDCRRHLLQSMPMPSAIHAHMRHATHFDYLIAAVAAAGLLLHPRRGPPRTAQALPMNFHTHVTTTTHLCFAYYSTTLEPDYGYKLTSNLPRLRTQYRQALRSSCSCLPCSSSTCLCILSRRRPLRLAFFSGAPGCIYMLASKQRHP